MKAVWKFELDRRGLNIIQVPSGSEIVHVGMQEREEQNVLCVWALVSPGNKPVPIELLVVGTGHKVDEAQWTHKQTFFDRDLVWHLFIQRERPSNLVDDQMWVVGIADTSRGEPDGKRPHPWGLVGVYKTYEEAMDACWTSNHLMGPVTPGKALPNGEWHGAFYPLRKSKA